MERIERVTAAPQPVDGAESNIGADVADAMPDSDARIDSVDNAAAARPSEITTEEHELPTKELPKSLINRVGEEMRFRKQRIAFERRFKRKNT